MLFGVLADPKQPQRVDDQTGDHSTFYTRLHREEEVMNTALEIKKDHRTERSIENKKIKILIADDEVAFTRSAKLTLELKDNYEVRVENDPCLAIDTAPTLNPTLVQSDSSTRLRNTAVLIRERRKSHTLYLCQVLVIVDRIVNYMSSPNQLRLAY